MFAPFTKSGLVRPWLTLTKTSTPMLPQTTIFGPSQIWLAIYIVGLFPFLCFFAVPWSMVRDGRQCCNLLQFSWSREASHYTQILVPEKLHQSGPACLILLLDSHPREVSGGSVQGAISGRRTPFPPEYFYSKFSAVFPKNRNAQPYLGQRFS